MLEKLKQKVLSMNAVENYRKMYPYIHPYRYRAILALSLTIPVGSMDAIIAMFLRPFMDTVMIERNIQEATYIPILIIAFSFMQSLCNYGSTYFNTWVGGRITKDLKAKLYSKIMRNEPSFFDSMTSGDVVFRCNNDVDTACSGLLSSVKMFVTRIFSSFALICVLLWNSWQLSIIAISVMLIAMYPLTTLRKRIKNMMKDSVLSGSAVITSYNETFAGNRIISSYNLYTHQQGRFQKILDFVFLLSMRMTKRTGILSPLMHFIVSFGIAGVIWLGSYLIINNILTPGEFVSFIAALLMLYTPLKSMGSSFAGVQMAFMAMERVFTLLEREPEIKDKENAVELKAIKKSIEYKDVCFEYLTDKPVLEHINLKINVGDNVAFVGNSGGGKTSLVNLLPRFYEPTSGEITIDGTNIEDLTLESLREHIAIVFQDNFLFCGTIRENILLGKTDATQEDIDNALSNSYLKDFIDSLEKGLDTEIGERGIRLSGGQKQRVAIARAFIKNAPIVILDEATSALDNKSEAVVQNAINNLMKDRTVLIIAHRLSTVRNADMIIVVNHGEIAEMGTHDELIANDTSLYYSLYNTSLGGKE